MIKIYFWIGLVLIVLIGLFFLLLNTLTGPTEWFNQLNSLSTFFLVIVGFLAFTAAGINVYITRKMVDKMAEQLVEIRRQQLPAISVKIVPTKSDPNIFNIVIQNTGKSSAYNISTVFSPDLPYRKGRINELSVFKSLPVLEPNEKVEFFFASAIDHFKSTSPKSAIATISYFTSQPSQNNHPEKYTSENQIDTNIYENQLVSTSSSMNQIFNEVSQLRKALVLLLANIEDKL